MATHLKSALKRSYSDITSDDVQDPLPRKRCKVQFNEAENKVKVFDSEKSTALVKAEVKQAVERHSQGDSSRYNAIKEIFTLSPGASDAPSSTLLCRYLQAVVATSGLIGKRCGDLVDAILDCSWVGRDDEFVGWYRNALVHLISAHGSHASPILEALVDKFVTLRSSHGRLPRQAIVRRSIMRERVHGTISQILQKAPSTLSTLSGVVNKSFPYTTDTVKAHVNYVSNLLGMASYAPALRSEILSLTMERLVKIDVQIQVDVEDLEEELDEKLLEDIMRTLNQNALDGDEDSDSEELDDAASTVDADLTQKRLHDLKQAVIKLDAILDMLFEHYHSSFVTSTVTEKESMFDQMVSIFTRSILPTYRSRHVQFLLFHFGQGLPSLTDTFTDTLIKVIRGNNQPTMVRRSAAAYLASFIARSAHVQSHTIVDTFLSLSYELERLRIQHEKNTNCCPDLHRFSTYYAISQAMLYIFCFRWRDLLTEEEDDDAFDADDLKWEPGVKEAFHRNIYSPLNPLKVCAPVIVNQFAAVANHLKFMYIYPKIETNKRVRLTRSVGAGFGSVVERETALSNKTGESVFQLDAYFPFDPYSLPRSQRWLKGDYREWKAVPGMDDDEDDEDESESEEDSDQEEDVTWDEPTETESDHRD